jgi:hypothetical protein
MMSRKNYDQKRTKKKQPPVPKTDEGNLEAALIPC